jgi:glycosyltransferase involved in cell wall biosynthesis
VILVSIVVLNYNYAAFVGDAIRSALAQTYPSVEVVVVDNGSTDDSLRVIESFGDRVDVVRVAHNIGQGEGYNAGFAAAHGEWIVWLDADDVLDADAIATCMALVRPGTAKVQYPLRCIDHAGNRLPGTLPYLRHQGDVLPLIRLFGHYGGPPGSGNLYRMTAIRAYFPVDPQDWPIGTDTVPFITAPFHGSVADTGRALGSYRLHRRAVAAVPGYRGNYATSIASEVRLNYASRDLVLRMLRERSGVVVATPALTLPVHVRNRIVSWRSSREQHPFKSDGPGSLRALMNESLRACPGYSWIDRFSLRAWTAGVLFAPMGIARLLMRLDRSSTFFDSILRLGRRASR